MKCKPLCHVVMRNINYGRGQKRFTAAKAIYLDPYAWLVLRCAGYSVLKAASGMKKKPSKFDFRYAVDNTEIIAMPSKTLETFGATVLNYYLISELMDVVDKVRVREGRIHAERPQIVTPEAYTEAALEGFGEEAEKYVDWLQQHSQQLRILRYGFKIRKEEFSEHVISDNVKAVTERVQEEVRNKNEPFSAIVRGVDDPWDVCLLKLIREVLTSSVPANVQELESHHLFGQTDGIPNVVRDEIEQAFEAASADRSRIKALSGKLQQHGVFKKYEDRFFALVKGTT